MSSLTVHTSPNNGTTRREPRTKLPPGYHDDEHDDKATADPNLWDSIPDRIVEAATPKWVIPPEHRNLNLKRIGRTIASTEVMRAIISRRMRDYPPQAKHGLGTLYLVASQIGYWAGGKKGENRKSSNQHTILIGEDQWIEISIKALARTMHMNRAPVRTALTRLQEIGLLDAVVVDHAPEPYKLWSKRPEGSRVYFRLCYGALIKWGIEWFASLPKRLQRVHRSERRTETPPPDQEPKFVRVAGAPDDDDDDD